MFVCPERLHHRHLASPIANVPNQSTMSFLADAAEMATLEETLAFIDACDSGSPVPTAVTTNPVSTARVSTARAPARCATPQQRRQEKDHQLGLKMKPARGKSTASASTARHRRIKAEIMTLRSETAELQQQLEQLHALKHVSPALQSLVTDAENPNATLTKQDKWSLVQLSGETRALTGAEHVVVQYRKRLQSEKTNRELKAIMANQRKLNDTNTHHDLLRVFQGMTFVETTPLLPYRRKLHADVGVAQLAWLEQRVESLYRSGNSMLRFEPMPSVSARTMITHDKQRGKTVEIATITPLECPMRDAIEVVWNEFNTWVSGWRILSRMVSMMMESPVGVLDFRKSNFVRKFEEADRTVIIWADLMTLPRYGIQFRNETWVVITPSATDPHSASVVHIFAQIFVDASEGSPSYGNGAPSALDAAFAALGNMYRQFLQSHQNALLEETQEAMANSPIAV
ncbi:hypothetical protein BBJ28_00022899 [Nothophytophthora sp. Chile5]|nr:hypothetical protein BBJ28_00022899 [Nothophytophthora sp. Chile5]